MKALLFSNSCGFIVSLFSSIIVQADTHIPFALEKVDQF